MNHRFNCKNINNLGTKNRKSLYSRTSHDFLDLKPKAQSIKLKKKDKLDFIKMLTFTLQKTILNG